jgi:hypothetical protein
VIRCRFLILGLSVLLGSVLSVTLGTAQVTPVTPDDAAAVAGNWLRLGQELEWGWTDAQPPKPSAAQTFERDKEVVGYYFELGKNGYVVVPACRELPPITAYSTDSRLKVSDEDGFASLLKDALQAKQKLVQEALDPGAPAEWQPVRDEIENYRQMWADYTTDFVTFTQAVEAFNRQRVPSERRGRYSTDDINPLLTTSWHQSSPYNESCPMGDGGRCYVGCGATAMTQVMAYWKYPTSGTGSCSYTWNGDQSCGGSTPSETLSATFSDTYDWAHILGSYSGGEAPVYRDAVAELCYEAGVAVRMDYGHCASSSNFFTIQSAYPTYFRYSSEIDVEYRSSYGTADGWFAMLQAELNLYRPMFYYIYSHFIVCDGWRVSGTNQVHMNYGWGGSYTQWYTVDGLYCPWSGCTSTIEMCLRRIKPSTALVVSAPNGGETLFAGDSDTIRWNTAYFGENVSLELNRNYPSGNWESIVGSTLNDGEHPWIVSGPSTTTARVRVRGVLHPFLGDTSDANFTIYGPPTITVISPNGGNILTVGTTAPITWSSERLTGNVCIELKRYYPGGGWDTLAASVANTSSWNWPVTRPASTSVRVRLTGVSFPETSDTSDANFTIYDPNQPPVLTHDPLADFAVGTGTVTAIATDDAYRSVVSVKMFYRLRSAEEFDSLALSPTGNPNEYATSLAGMGVGSYEYYLMARDGGGLSTTVPGGAPASLYTFDVAGICAHEMAYDDGSAEWFNWSEGDAGAASMWAVQFGPVDTPFVLCGARFAASRLWPDSVHSRVKVSIYAADGPGDFPGSLLTTVLTGSVGNVIGGLPAGTNWARVFFNDGSGGPLLIYYPRFYVAVANDVPTAFEAFGRDSNGPNAQRSFYYDPCEEEWYSEDDTLASENTFPGNRLIRVQGYSLSSPQVVIRLGEEGVRLHWNNLWAPAYRVYLAGASGGPYTLMQTTADTFLTVTTVDTAAVRRFYQVQAASE